MQALQAQAKTLLENSEALRQDSLAKYKELEKTVQEFLSKKQAEFKDKVGGSGRSGKDSTH